MVDVVEVLTDSGNPRDYWYKMKIREKDESGVQLSTIWGTNRDGGAGSA